MNIRKTYDVAVAGAGVFGAWTAYHLERLGKKVALFDAYGPANGRASSGGESRIIRMGYGADEIYTRWSIRALALWQKFFDEIKQPLFHRTGVLWVAHGEDGRAGATLRGLEKFGVRYERLARAELEKRYPWICWGVDAWGVLEPESGALMARRAVEEVVNAVVKAGADYFPEAMGAPRGKGRLASVATPGGAAIPAEVFVFACGSWLPKVFPELLGDRIFPTRQEVFFLGLPAGERGFAPPFMPVWIDLRDEVYGVPDLESRGFKVGLDRHGPPFDPDTESRVVSAEVLRAVRELVAKRFPTLKDAPVLETRVCHYENTSNGDFLIDQHPAFDNVWLVGGGSGHGFKHGPVVGEYVAARIAKEVPLEPRFGLATKGVIRQRAVF